MLWEVISFVAFEEKDNFDSDTFTKSFNAH